MSDTFVFNSSYVRLFSFSFPTYYMEIQLTVYAQIDFLDLMIKFSQNGQLSSTVFTNLDLKK